MYLLSLLQSSHTQPWAVYGKSTDCSVCVCVCIHVPIIKPYLNSVLREMLLLSALLIPQLPILTLDVFHA